MAAKTLPHDPLNPVSIHRPARAFAGDGQPQSRVVPSVLLVGSDEVPYPASRGRSGEPPYLGGANEPSAFPQPPAPGRAGSRVPLIQKGGASPSPAAASVWHVRRGCACGRGTRGNASSWCYWAGRFSSRWARVRRPAGI